MTDQYDEAADPLVAAWQSAEFPLPSPSAVSARLRERVEAGSRRMVRGTVFEVVLTVMVFGTIALQPGAFGRPGAAVTWGLSLLHAAVIWGFTLWNRRGVWKPFTADTAAFRSLLAERARRSRRAARFTIGFVAIEVVAAIVASFLVGPGVVAATARRPLLSAAIALFVVGTIAVAARVGRAAQRELAWLGRVEREAA